MSTEVLLTRRPTRLDCQFTHMVSSWIASGVISEGHVRHSTVTCTSKPIEQSAVNNEGGNQPVNHKGLGESLPVDPEPMWDTPQWHRRHPSQRCIPFAISWRADHLPTGSCRITRNSALQVLGVHTQKWKTKPGRQYRRTKFHLFYLEMSSLLIFALSLHVTAYSTAWTGLECRRLRFAHCASARKKWNVATSSNTGV